ncbi:MAG: efflux RND transporter periplasmic adaptor subunit [Anaerolineales bacterium]
MSKNQKTWIIGGVSVVVVIALVLVVMSVRGQASNNTAAYQTTTVQLGTLTSTVEGAGSVASTQSANLSWGTGGQVGTVTSQIGTVVKAGDVLATLVRDSLSQSTLQSNLVSAQENLDQLTSPSAIASAQAAVATDEQTLSTAQRNVSNLNFHNPSAIANAQAAVTLAKINLDTATANYNSLNLPADDPAKALAYQAMYGAQQKYNSTVYTYNSLTGNASQTSIDAANAALALAKANLAQDQNYLAALTGGTVPADATGAALLKLEQAKLAVQTAQDNLAENSLTAPFDGTVTQANAVPGDIVSSGESMFRIDNLSNLVVAVQVTEIDINSIKVGQPVTITFNAIPNKTYTGKVIKTDLAGTVSQNTTTFSSTVQITNADALIKPGMAANVTITTNQVANALLVPSTSIFTDSSGQQYVYLVQNGTPTTVPVTIGAVSDTTTQITGNSLQAGDTIVLSFASTSTTGGGGFGLGIGGIVGGGGTRVINGGTP